MPRSSVKFLACLATFGRCSLILMPETAVGISRYGPPLFRSKVCDCAGPPAIHNKMHDLCFAPSSADSLARAVSTLNHGATQPPKTPAAESRNASRRETRQSEIMAALHSPIADELRSVQQRP